MKLSPREQESLLISQAGRVAQGRLARGLRLNHPEAVALIACQIQELIRDGTHPVSELMQMGRQMLGRNQVQPGVEDMISEVQVEGTFRDGTKLVTVHQPIVLDDGNLELALYGSFLPIPDLSLFNGGNCLHVVPGQLYTENGDIEMNVGRKTANITVTSLCDRPIQVGSHYHFLEVNKFLQFDRTQAYGKRLNIPAGTAVRFEPGETREVQLVEIAGNSVIHGGNFLSDGKFDESKIAAILENIKSRGFAHKTQDANILKRPKTNLCVMPRHIYAHTYGPTTGDCVRLGDTSLIIEVEKDFTVYGDECKFGGGKVCNMRHKTVTDGEREGAGEEASSERCRPTSTMREPGVTAAVTACGSGKESGSGRGKAGQPRGGRDGDRRKSGPGQYRERHRRKDGMIVGIGKAGNPDVMANVNPNLICGATTEAIAGEGLILTAGALDAHVHFICPQLAREAVASGVTTMFGGGTGPATGSNATTCTPGPNHIKLKLHEDWGSTPAAIDTCLRVAEKHDVQVMIHTDTLNESSCVEQTIEAFKGRTIHTYHSEGAGGGHAPDIIKVCGVPNVLPSSTNPTRPYTVNTIDEHLDMLMVCHHLDKNLSEDVAFAESRIRAETIAAEDILHDMGAISIIASDSQAMGRVGEVITRTWQTADKMKQQRGALAGETGDNDNLRVRRYVAKYTINPAISNGMAHLIGSVEKDKMADLVLWKPAFFGAKPEIIIKGGHIAWAQMGMPNASIPTPEPVKTRKMFGAYGKAVGNNSVMFVSKTCPTSMTQKASRSPWFRARFVENMKLFLDKREVFDPETYNMLQGDPTPFGTGGLDIEGTVSYFPRSEPGTTATGTPSESAGKGAEIDNHDYVFRVNVALTGKQYVNDVGNKSSFYGFFPESVVNRINFGRDNKFDDVTLMMMMMFSDYHVKWLRSTLQGREPDKICANRWGKTYCRSMPAPKYKQGNMMIVHPHFFRYVHERFLNSTSSRPTTGTMVILMAIHLCDQVDMYGFGFDPRFPLHYYDGQKVEDAMNEPSSHSYPNEKILWRKLHSEGLVNWKLRPGT
uniref:urease n=1 Tax=Branchiostoma floridae TaxID=7739 RepID=C3ZLX4_BRAFL|eukprot:XP_002590444.1 hypothetical protein BRAFLDRAFT_124574 [Branchiostoma floridae]